MHEPDAAPSAPSRAIVVYKPLPAACAPRVQYVACLLARLSDQASSRRHNIARIDVFRRRYAVYTLDSMRFEDARDIAEKAVRSSRLDMAVLSKPTRVVCDLYSRDDQTFYDRI